MLAVIGAASIEELFDEIPANLKVNGLRGVPAGLSEAAITRLMTERAGRNVSCLCFLGAGAYEHHIPAAVWEIATRGEFYSAYTPYQAEASQGTLQLIYEYQSMLAPDRSDVSNASIRRCHSICRGLPDAVALRGSRSAGCWCPVTSIRFGKVARSLPRVRRLNWWKLAASVAARSCAGRTRGGLAACAFPSKFPRRLEPVDELTDKAPCPGAPVIAAAIPRHSHC
jgi:glycine dehydrogenase subunit 1